MDYFGDFGLSWIIWIILDYLPHRSFWGLAPGVKARAFFKLNKKTKSVEIGSLTFSRKAEAASRLINSNQYRQTENQPRRPPGSPMYGQSGKKH